jgi:hypothetical protein
MMKYIELYKDDHRGCIEVLFGRSEHRGKVSWTISLDEKFSLSPRGGRADPSGNDGQRGVKQTMCVRDGTRYDDPRYAGWAYTTTAMPVLYYYIINPYDDFRYLVAPPSLDEPYDDERGVRRYGGPEPIIHGNVNSYEERSDYAVATGLMPDGESSAEGWAEYGPDADQYD